MGSIFTCIFLDDFRESHIYLLYDIQHHYHLPKLSVNRIKLFILSHGTKLNIVMQYLTLPRRSEARVFIRFMYFLCVYGEKTQSDLIRVSLKKAKKMHAHQNNISDAASNYVGRYFINLKLRTSPKILRF